MSRASHNAVVLYVAPNPTLARQAKRVVQDNDWEQLVAVEEGNNYAGLELVTKYRARGVLGVISRGGTFQAIRRYNPDLPMIRDVGADSLLLMLHFQKISQNSPGTVAISCTDSMLPKSSTIDAAVASGLIENPRIIRHREPGHPELTRHEILQGLRDFKNAGGTTVLCDTLAAELAREVGLETQEIETTDQQVADTIRKMLSMLKQVFVIMPFTKGPEEDDIYSLAVKPALQACGLVPLRADEDASGDRINPIVEKQIRESFLLIADLSRERPNCYFEIGFARALGKRIILIMRKGEKVHFDAYDLPRIEYEQITELRKRLVDKVGELLKYAG